MAADIVSGNFSLTRGREAAGEMFSGSGPPTAVMCACEVHGIRFYHQRNYGTAGAGSAGVLKEKNKCQKLP
jgi:hypothetical protein